MLKKLQVFISSTYTDLLEERQAAVAAVLKAGHIPAGMELFSAGDRSQLDTIRSWIEQSDVYMLILGGRYGTIEPDSGLSYTELEFNYAVELGKPLFAVVISESGLDKKLKTKGADVIERVHGILLRDFRAKVLSNISSFFDEPKDIRLAVFESLPDLSRNKNLIGWVRGDEVVDTQPLVDEVKKLSDENTALRAKLTQMERQVEKKNEGQREFDEIQRILGAKEITVRAGLAGNDKSIDSTALYLFKVFRGRFVTGITNSMDMSNLDNFLYFKVGPELATLDLVDYQKVSGVAYQRCSTTSKGKQFLARLSSLELDQTQAQLSKVTAATQNTDVNATTSPLAAPEQPTETAAAPAPKPKRVTRKKTA
jgi:hypothetical protein